MSMFVTHEGQVVINEMNTMPGFTQHSMFPHAREHGVLVNPGMVLISLMTTCFVRHDIATRARPSAARRPEGQDR